MQQSYTLEDDTGYFRDVVATECDVWLAEVNGRIVGLMAMKGSLIDQLFVDVDFQGQGVGTALLVKARERSPAGLQLYTFQKNVTAREFYERHGFTAVRFGASPPPENEPDVKYAWQPPRNTV
jgi:ribosomal protein S18 acetylase RimI-like enzyme